MKEPLDTMQVPQGQRWSYREPQTGVVVESNHWKDFLAKAFAHREANGLYTGGGWQHEVSHLFCLQNPHIACREIGQPERKLEIDDIRRFAITMSNWIGAETKWVSQEEAERRAAICTSGANGHKCPHNTSVSGCWGCKGPLNWIVSMLGSRTTSQDDKLEQCERCLCTLRAKVHLPMDVLTENQEPVADLPDYCWMKQ